MPFTLAHPAAVLPLKRYCPRPLNFCALVAGSLAPDAGYCFARFNWDELAHEFVGSFTFDLPASLLMLLFIYGLRHPLLDRLPDRLRPLLLPRSWQPVPPPFVMISSILLGTWTHLVWDSCTHNHGWLGAQLPFLQMPLATWHWHTLLVCHVLWYASSSVGVAGVCLAYERRLRAATPRAPAVRWRNAVLVGLLVLPIEAVHHAVHGVRGIVVVSVCSLVLIISVTLKIGGELANSRKSPETPQ